MLLLRPNFDGADGQRLPCLTRHCSRQCRRTRRLRSIPANARVIREGRLTGAAEYRAGHAVARCDAVPACSAGDHFEHGANRPPEGMRRSESGLVRSAMRRMRPFPAMKTMSSDR